MSENLFRIGGVYRNKRGHVVTLVTPKESESDEYVALSLRDDGNVNGEALHRLSDGVNDEHRHAPEFDLLPGELHQVNGEWVPIEDPELVALQTRPQHVEASCEEEKPAKTVVKRVRRPDAEPKRPPLPGYGQRTPFDPWKDFIVHHREEVSVNAKPFAGLSLDAPEQFRPPRSI